MEHDHKEPVSGIIKRKGELDLPAATPVPAITLRSTGNRDVSLDRIGQNRHLVLFCYPGDREGLRFPELTGCTPEACSFHDLTDSFADAGAAVFGVSTQSTERQKSFLEREGLTLELLSDSRGKLAHNLGLPVWESANGERFLDRITLVFRKDHGLIDAFHDPEPEEHARRALDIVRSLTQG